MNTTDLALVEAIETIIKDTPGVRTVRLVRPGESVEVPLSGFPAALVEFGAAEPLVWPDVPPACYRLLHWRIRVLDRSVPGTRAFRRHAEIAEAVKTDVAAGSDLGGLAADGPPSERVSELDPPAGAVRMTPIRLGNVEPGRPTELSFAGAAGRWPEPMPPAVTFAGQDLFSSGPHALVKGSPVRRVADQVFNGLAGGLTVDLGDGPRELAQTGVLSGTDGGELAAREAAVESLVDGQRHRLTDPDGNGLQEVRLEQFERIEPVLAGLRRHRRYRVLYRQFAR